VQLPRAPVMKFFCFKYNTRLKNFRDSKVIQEYNSIGYYIPMLR